MWNHVTGQITRFKSMKQYNVSQYMEYSLYMDM